MHLDLDRPSPDIPGFEDLVLVGAGGMGSVYRAVDIETGSLCAIKLLRSAPEAPGRVRRFRREFSAVSRLRHPNIVSVYRYGVAPAGEYIVMEWVPGGDLWRVASRRARKELHPRPLPPQWVAPVIATSVQVCDALSYLHGCRILHRDLKPENILIDSGGKPRLVDFGIAKPLAIDPVVPLTADGETVGTARYMSPEQARNLNLDGRADLYSLGVILFEIISGAPPFSAGSLFDLLMAHVTEPAPRLADRAPHIPSSLCDFVNLLLEKDRSARPPDPGAVREELLAHLAPDGTLQSRSMRHADPRDLPLSVIAAVEAASRAEALIRREEGADWVRSEGPITWDPTFSEFSAVEDLEVKHEHAITEDGSTPGSGIGAHDDPLSSPTLEARVDPRLGNSGLHLSTAAGNVFVPSDVPELFAPAFRGRDSLLNGAVESFQAGARKASVHWFRGPRGSGCTRLLAEIRDVLRFDVGSIVLEGRGVDPAIGLSAIRLIFDRVPSYLRKLPDEDIVAALGSSLQVIGDLCPGLAERLRSFRQEEHRAPDPGSRRVLYFQATERLIALLLRQAPIAILIDEVDAADPDSLDLLRHLATLPSDERLDRGRPSLIALASVEAAAPWAGSEIKMPPLFGVDIAVTLQTALGWTVPPTRLARRAVLERVNHSPRELLLWTGSLLEAAGFRSGRETNEETLLLAASEGPRGRWRAHLTGLDPESIELLVLLSLLPRPVVMEWLLLCGDWEEGVFVGAVNTVVQRGLVVERPTVSGWGFELTDREIGDSALAVLPSTALTTLMQRFSVAVLREHADHPVDPEARPGLAARAYLKADLTQQALPLLELATRQEQSGGRAASGLAMADLWVAAAEEAGFDDLFRALETRVQLAGAACEWGRTKEDLDRMDQLTRGRPQEQLRSLTARATTCQQSQDHEGVLQSVEAAFLVALDVDASREELFRLSHLLASVDLRGGSLVTARDRWFSIASDAKRTESLVWEVLCRSAAAGADLQLGQFENSEEGCRQALVLARRLSDRPMELHLRYVIASLEALRDEPMEAIAELDVVAEQAAEIGALRVLSQAVTTLGEVHRYVGNLEEADAHLERGERLLRATGQRVSLSRCLAERSMTALAMSDLLAAQGFAAGAGMAASLTSGVLLGQERIHCALGRVAEAHGDRHALAAAREAALSCLDQQAKHLGPEHLSGWTSVGQRMEVVTWAGWSPR